MSYTFQELIDRAVSIAGRGIEPSQSPALAAEMIAEDLVGPVFNTVARKVAGDAALRSLLRRSITLTFTNGMAVLDQDILEEFLSESLMLNVLNLSARYSWESQFSNFVRNGDLRLGSYSVNDSTIYVREPGAVYIFQDGIDDDRELITPCVPVLPTSASAILDVRDELLDNLVMGLAAALQGGTP